MGFCNANVIGQNLPSNEEKRHPHALFSDSVIHSLLITLQTLVGYHFAGTVWQSRDSHTYKHTNMPRVHTDTNTHRVVQERQSKL